jgi:hypothetical protein
MTTIGLLLVLALSSIEFDVATVPLSSEAKITLTPAGRVQIKREGSVSRLKVEVDQVMPPSAVGQMFNTYVVWAVSPEGDFDNLGELELNNQKGQFNATTRLTQLGILISAEPHYMVDRPSSFVVYRSQSAKDDVRRRTGRANVGAYDYSALKPTAAGMVHASVIQARAAFQVAQAAGAASLAPEDFRSAQIAIGSMEELVTRAVPLEILWPTANEAIRWSQRAATTARSKR